MKTAFEMSDLTPEWRRIELLAACASTSRRGERVREETLEELARVQRDVRSGRGSGVWDGAGTGLRPLECDILACALAPEARPRIGWLFQTLQAGSASPYPTPALLQELLALDDTRAAELYGALTIGAPLRTLRLVELDGDGPFHVLRPGAGVAARVLARPAFESAPPGSVAIPGGTTWGDLVLPDDRIELLRELLAWLRHRDTVFDRWGARRIGGPVALFSGPSGTGKTLAASVLATELEWPLYRVDVGLLVSKYIGETEKNLNRLFDAAHGRPLVLQIDEADSLFGRRGDVKDARDRYANLEVSHLLARIETHEGPCILTTNLRRHLDPAFLRRFQIVVDFPRPGPPERARLWDLHLPPRAPRAPDLDIELLGRDLNLTGGAIRNAALHASFLAARSTGVVALEHVALAAWRELAKENRDLAPSELGELEAHLPEHVLDEER